MVYLVFNKSRFAVGDIFLVYWRYCCSRPSTTAKIFVIQFQVFCPQERACSSADYPLCFSTFCRGIYSILHVSMSCSIASHFPVSRLLFRFFSPVSRSCLFSSLNSFPPALPFLFGVLSVFRPSLCFGRCAGFFRVRRV